jgi:ABC-type Fe3+/spermidine/putrescine transport system ATPase subunit
MESGENESTASREQLMSGRRPADVSMDGIGHSFGDLEVLHQISLDVKAGSFLTLLGPSGSGKTTLLRLIGGLISVQQGNITIGGQDVTRMPPQQRGIGFVFQQYALFPHLTVFENVAFPLKLRRVHKRELDERVMAVLSLVDLARLAGRMPAQLSGGQQQRVALARAIVFEPTVLLMDEPLGSLDKRLRRRLQIEMRQLQQTLGITTIYVTHDQEEAFTMSDEIAVMNEGHILQVATPINLYEAPSDAFVADFVGDVNRFEGFATPVSDSTVRFVADPDLQVTLHATSSFPSKGRAIYCIRPDHVQLGAAQCENRLAARVLATVFDGNRIVVHAELAGGTRLVAHLPTGRNGSVPSAEDRIYVGWGSEDGILFRSEQ